jgi:enoyl-CoA hydratase
VSTTRHDHVLVIEMTRHAKRNAIDSEMTAALDAALNLLEDDPDLRCGILTGGDTVFCAGTDLVAGAGPPTQRGGNYGVVARTRSTPVIAAVERAALGGGLEIALACDLVIAGRSAQFGLPEVTHGVVANCGALFRAPRALPVHIAKQLLLTGRPISADRAHALGLVNDVVDDRYAARAALALAATIAANAPVAVRATLDAVNATTRDADAVGWAITADADARVHASLDLTEGITAFTERRAARWTGR